VNECGALFPKTALLHKNSSISIQHLFITHCCHLQPVICEHISATYISNISSTSHHHNEHKEHKMYVQFSFYYGLQSLGFISNNWIEYNSTRAPALYARLSLHSQHQLRWGNNPQQISICTINKSINHAPTGAINKCINHAPTCNQPVP